jgi:hypothetical protein
MAKLPLTPTEAAQLFVDAGFRSWQVVRMGQIAMAESGLDGYAVNVVHRPGSPAHRSLDVGLCQINTWWNGVTDLRGVTDLLDPFWNAHTAYTIFTLRDGLRNPVLGYQAWTTYTSGAFQRWQTQAVEAARAVGAWP